jgi:hypothetical protein
MRKQRWLWAPEGKGVIPLGTATILAGAGGAGKTSFALHLAAMGTQGTLPGDLHGQKLKTIIFGPEDDWATVHNPRLIAAGADIDLIARVDVTLKTGPFQTEREMKFPLDMTEFRQAVDQTGAKIIILDPAPSLMGGDMNKVQDVRQSFEPLLAYAQQNDMTIILITHFNKGAGSSSNKVSGSHGWRDLTRSLLVFALDDESGECIMTQDKNNYGTSRASYRLTMETVEVPTPDGVTSVGRTVILGESELTVDQIINRPIDGAEDDTHDRGDKERWLIEVLTEAGGSMSVKDLENACRAAGYTFKTFQNLRGKIRNPRVVTGRNGFGKGSIPYWQIEEENTIHPDENTIDPHRSILPKAGTYAGINGERDSTPDAVTTHPDIPPAPGIYGMYGKYEGNSGSMVDAPDSDDVEPTLTLTAAICSREFCERTAAEGNEKCQHHLDLAARMDTIIPGWDAA